MIICQTSDSFYHSVNRFIVQPRIYRFFYERKPFSCQRAMSKNLNSKWNFHRLAERPWSAASPNGTLRRRARRGCSIWHAPFMVCPTLHYYNSAWHAGWSEPFLAKEISPGSPYLFFCFSLSENRFFHRVSVGKKFSYGIDWMCCCEHGKPMIVFCHCLTLSFGRGNGRFFLNVGAVVTVGGV